MLTFSIIIPKTSKVVICLDLQKTGNHQPSIGKINQTKILKKKNQIKGNIYKTFINEGERN